MEVSFLGKKKIQILEDLFFSNRNETKIIEDFVSSYNKMDVDGMKNAFAEDHT